MEHEFPHEWALQPLLVRQSAVNRICSAFAVHAVRPDKREGEANENATATPANISPNLPIYSLSEIRKTLLIYFLSFFAPPFVYAVPLHGRRKPTTNEHSFH